MLWSMTMDSLDAVRVRGLRKAYGELHGARRRGPHRGAAARCSRCSAPTAPARRRWSRSSKATASADAGTVSVLGYDPGKRERAFRERIGIVLQEAGLDPAITVREAVELYGAAYPNPRAARRAARAGRARRPPRRARARRPLRRPAPPARPRARHRRRPRADLPRRADDRLRPGRAPPVVGDDRQPARARQVDPADHALHGGGAAPRRPRRRARRAAASSPRARRTSSAATTHDARRLPRCPPSTRTCRCPPARSSSAASCSFRTATPTRDLAPLLEWAAAPRHGARAPDRHASHPRGRLSRARPRRPHDRSRR